MSLGRWGPAEVRGCRVATALSGPDPCNQAPSGLWRCSFLGGRCSCVSPATPAAQSPHPAPAPRPAPALQPPAHSHRGETPPSISTWLGVGGREPSFADPQTALPCSLQRLNGLYPITFSGTLIPLPLPFPFLGPRGPVQAPTSTPSHLGPRGPFQQSWAGLRAQWEGRGGPGGGCLYLPPIRSP